jgi:hypothetical protein
MAAIEEVLAQSLENGETDGSSQLAKGPLFVVGIFRSGTSLLYALLNQHPQIALMYEGDLAHLPSLFWFPTDTSRWLARWDAWNGALTRHSVGVRGIPSGISDLPTAVREAYVRYGRQKKKDLTIWGCKSPTYFDEIARLGRTFPNARFIIIWRDLRSICSSVLKAAQDGGGYFRRSGTMVRVMMGYREMKAQCDQLVSLGVPVHQLFYEDLVRDPEAAMRAICQFLQIPFDPSTTSLAGADHSAIENAPHHEMVKADKIVASNGKKSGLPPELNRKIDRYLFLWRKQFAGAWPVYPLSLDDGLTAPGLAERFWDRLKYDCVRTWNRATPVFFSIIPFSLWTAYRKLRRRPYTWGSKT